jgi:hypothetical protein
MFVIMEKERWYNACPLLCSCMLAEFRWYLPQYDVFGRYFIRSGFRLFILQKCMFASKFWLQYNVVFFVEFPKIRIVSFFDLAKLGN